MKYNCLDFAILCALNTNQNTEGDILISASSSFPCPPSFHLFECCMKRLYAGGYIVKKGDKIYPTDKTKKLFKSKKLFEGKDKFISRLEDEFLSRDEEITNNADDLQASTVQYKYALTKLTENGEFGADLRLAENDGENCIVITPPANSRCYYDVEIIKNDILTLPLEYNTHLPAQLFDSARALISPSKAKKVCVFDGTSYYVLTMLQEEGKIKVSAQKILFNAKRFIGKTDSSLDYAQCADMSVSFHTTQDNLYMSALLILLEYDCRK